ACALGSLYTGTAMASDFGTRFMPEMAICHYQNGWSQPALVPVENSLHLHPGAHVLHYASTCFEGLKAFRHEDDSVVIFRMDRNIARFTQSSELLCLPPIDSALTGRMINDLVARFRDEVPVGPSSMYIRPTHIGTEAAIGKAAAPSTTSTQFVLLSPVGDYFSGGEASLRLLLDDVGVRCGVDHGVVKGGGNYASALKHIERARTLVQADQVLFCPGGYVQETGAANFILIDGDELITKALDESFLHGVTRESILTLARDNGMRISERELSIDELLERSRNPECEAGLTGTAAVVAAVGTFIYQDKEYKVGSGQPGDQMRNLRKQLNDIQWGRTADPHNWLTRVR
ncbi:MAG: branched-chain amino acid aminotransferase, partial [Methylococcales bacterium]|nr:branched-chain amino acid aminotransferase [Methylococcales bacterium]